MAWNRDPDLRPAVGSLMERRNQQSRNRGRIYIDDSYHETYVALSSSPKEIGVQEESEHLFDSMKNVFMLAVFVGHSQGRREPLKDRRDIFAWAQFSEERDIPLLRALALAETERVEVLSNRSEILTIAEEYANAGIIEIQEKIADMRENKIMHLVSLLGARIPDDLISDLAEDAN